MAQNNPALFDALMAGGCGGNLERWITATSGSSYDGLVDAVEAFATAVDAAIPTIGGDGPSISQINLVQSIAQGIVAGRNLASIDSDTFADIAASIAAVFTECESRLNNVPSISGGGGGGGGSGQVTNVRWVDKNTAIPLIDQDGSYSKPFASAADCIAALALLEEEGPEQAAYTMMAWPGDYLADGLLEWTPVNPASALLISNAAGMTYTNSETPLPKFDSLSIANADLFLKGCIVQGENGIVSDHGTINVLGSQVWFKCQTVYALNVRDSHLIAVECTNGGADIIDSILQSGSINQSVGTTISIRGSKWITTPIVYDTEDAGNIIYVDSETNWWFTQTTPVITNGTKTVMSAV